MKPILPEIKNPSPTGRGKNKKEKKLFNLDRGY
jgi:hypothetical protein